GSTRDTVLFQFSGIVIGKGRECPTRSTTLLWLILNWRLPARRPRLSSSSPQGGADVRVSGGSSGALHFSAHAVNGCAPQFPTSHADARFPALYIPRCSGPREQHGRWVCIR